MSQYTPSLEIPPIGYDESATEVLVMEGRGGRSGCPARAPLPRHAWRGLIKGWASCPKHRKGPVEATI